MEERKRRTELVHIISLVALASALGILFLSLGYLIPGIELTTALFIPLLSALTVLIGGYKGGILLFLVSIPISFIDFPAGLFEYLPNILVGIIYGSVRKYLPSPLLSFLSLVLFSFLINYGLIYPLDFLYVTDLEEVFTALLHLDKEVFHPLFPAFFLLLSIGQSALTFSLCESELEKLGYKMKYSEKTELISFLSFFLISLLGFFLGYYLLMWLTYVSLGFLLLLSTLSLALTLRTEKPVMIVAMLIIPFLTLIAFFVMFFSLEGKARVFSFIPYILLTAVQSLLMLKYNKNHPEIKTEKKSDLLSDESKERKTEKK